MVSEVLELVWMFVELVVLDEALLLLPQGSSTDFGLSSGVLFCSWLVDATLWDFFNRV